MYQPLHTGLYTRWDIVRKQVESYLEKTRPAALEIWSCLIFNEQDTIIKLRAYTLQADSGKLIASVFIRFVFIVLEAMGYFHHFCPCQELRSSLIEESIQRGSERKTRDELRRGFSQEKRFIVLETWECEC